MRARWALAKELVKDENGEVDIKGYVTMIVSIMVGGIVIGVLMPSMTTGLAKLSEATPDLKGLIDAIPLLVVLAFVVAIVFWALASFEKK
ncbi:MAG: hypothetical protein SVE93_00530 [Candidatus Thermoplasmatota archaeon]|nr:hypothetical protein [Candidatus Thermoplasmatota archaeon]